MFSTITITFMIIFPCFADEVDEWNLKRPKRTGGGRVGDLCTQNTDCQSGMFCSVGQCICLSNYVPISSFCWPKVNPGDSGCVGDVQCGSVWPGARCAKGGLCQCPDYYVPAKTRDGTMCVASGVPPACPLPEPNNAEAPSPVTLLANPSTHALAPGSYMPVLCTSSSAETDDSNGGDGSTWCIYPDGERDVPIADLYNCVPHPQVRPEYFPEYAPTVDGICCHSRAFVCIQPMEQGEEPSVPRWWYNSITGTCTQFLWDPAQSDGVSPNNFRTMEHCESFCRDTCRRGPAQFRRSLRASLSDDFPVANCVRQSGSCAPENTCVQIGSLQQCCPTVAHLCSAAGGRTFPFGALPTSGGAEALFDPGIQIAGSAPTNRFYYDAEQGRCSNFIYEGGLGNFNNFVTKQDCEHFCSKLVCELGQPLRVAEGQWQRCELAADCPNTHSCDSAHRVCCPTAQTICTQPKRVGECTGSVSRYWYNAGTLQCELFEFTGCQGNDNNFEQLIECQMKCRNIASEPRCPQGRAHRDLSGLFTRCSLAEGCPLNHECHFDGQTFGCCPLRAWTCSLGSDRGTQCGAGRSFRFFFNAEKQNCESFQYEGCDGNANNFQSLDICQEYCGIGGCPNGGQPLRDQTSNQFLSCSDSQPCPSRDSRECVPINANGVIAHRCCPTKAFICSQPPQVGTVCRKASLTRWYFNIVTRECGEFGFGGCNGNMNNFESREQCTKFCSSAACAPGEIVYRREGNGDGRSGDGAFSSIFQCDSNAAQLRCPRDFRCVRDELGHRHVCCGSPPSAVCAEGEKPFWEAADETVRECQANVAGSCPSNFLCRFSAAHNKYFCCAPRNGTVCPFGHSLYRTPKSFRPLRCFVGTSETTPLGQCPDGFSCQSRVSSDSQGHCCSVEPICRGGSQFLVEELSQMPKNCVPGAFAECPREFQCEKSHANAIQSMGICCKRNRMNENDEKSAEDGCPPGESALFRESSVVQCDPFNPRDRGCPAKFTCQFASIHQRYQCCAKTDGNEEAIPIEREMPWEDADQRNNGCPGGQIASFDPKVRSVRLCTASAPSSCPQGFSCQFSELNHQFQCCAHKAGCPGQSVAFVNSSGSPRKCSFYLPQPMKCPIGFECHEVSPGVEICCTLGDEWRGDGQRKSKGQTEEMKREQSGREPRPIVVEGHSVEKAAKREGEPTQRGTNGSKCRQNEKWQDGKCRLRQFGDFCSVSEDCPPAFECIDNKCECEREKKPIGEQKQCELAGERHKEGKRRGEEKQKQKAGEKLRRRAIGETCRNNGQCQWNGAKCVRRKCQCIGGRAAFRNRCRRNVCDRFHSPQFGPFGTVVPCAVLASRFSRCLWPHRCVFSPLLHFYICCRLADVRVGTSAVIGTILIKSPTERRTETKANAQQHFVGPRKRERRCSDGRLPLLLPRVRRPVQCEASRRRCPAHFICWRRLCCPARQLTIRPNYSSPPTRRVDRPMTPHSSVFCPFAS
ncbi:hypothetical protein niasHS_002318 [Heterodera schachtii]|uniref:BPTI/Kunitz inhibitor domain-containing protein n=1 Tax=Heterodera schachtii TaxID=97005 RepID=A0ABD2KJK7_HETSC